MAAGHALWKVTKFTNKVCERQGWGQITDLKCIIIIR